MRLVEIVETLKTVETLFNVCLFPNRYWRRPKSHDVCGDRGDFEDGGNFVQGLFVFKQVEAGTEIA